jgi:hypothetical protein
MDFESFSIEMRHRLFCFSYSFGLIDSKPERSPVTFFNKWSNKRARNFPQQFLSEIANFGHFCSNYVKMSLPLIGFLEKFISGRQNRHPHGIHEFA